MARLRTSTEAVLPGTRFKMMQWVIDPLSTERTPSMYARSPSGQQCCLCTTQSLRSLHNLSHHKKLNASSVNRPQRYGSSQLGPLSTCSLYNLKSHPRIPWDQPVGRGLLWSSDVLLKG
jgi:hypothetical protein